MGAAIGALGGLSGGWLGTLGQRRQQLAEQRRWRDEVRRDAYVQYVTSARQLIAAQWMLSTILRSEGSAGPEWEDRFTVAHDAWVDFSAAAAAVTVAGPRQVADSAEVLRVAVLDAQRAAMSWLDDAREAGRGRLPLREAAFKARMKAVRKPDKAFQAAVRVALGTDS
ncbi:hypothetical protein [Streptomyces sp. NPDC059651]|uniref:hypothetical protein n=1 Tax=Streptomyces sp. NPDC059651 TaxID=3346897 RepID=UPI003696A6F2